jgi:hypothetical protein
MDGRGYQGGPEITSAEEFVRLQSSEDREEYMAAAHGWAEITVWLDVITRFPEMKTSVVHNKTVPIFILDILSQDPDREVRSWVTYKRKLTRELFERLAKDPDSGVRQSLAGNPKMPLDLLEAMIKDRNRYVRAKAQEVLTQRRKPNDPTAE